MRDTKLWGYQTMNILVLVMAAAAIAATLWCWMRRNEPSPPGPDPEPPDGPDDPRTPPPWEEKEPEDPSDPRCHEEQSALDVPGWRIVGASRRGKSHAHYGKYREDAFSLGESNGWQLIAVSDGAGSAKLSRVGSDVATRTAIEVLAAHFDAHPNEPEGALKAAAQAART